MPVIPCDADGIMNAARALREGALVIHPTETCYGIACDLTNANAVAALFAFKRRPVDKPVSGLFASVDDAKRYVVWNDAAERLARDLPGPLTLVLPLKDGAMLFPSPSGGTTLGVRVSSHPVAMALAQAYGSPISTTSANMHGQANPYSLGDLQAQFAETDLAKVVVLDGGTLPPNAPSKVIDLTRGDPTVLRS